jgi:hypothetical protein
MQSKGRIITVTAIKCTLSGALLGVVMGIILSTTKGALIGGLAGAFGAALFPLLLGRLVTTKHSRLLWLAIAFATPGAMAGAAISTAMRFGGAGAVTAGMIAVVVGFSMMGALALAVTFLILGVIIGLINVRRQHTGASFLPGR